MLFLLIEKNKGKTFLLSKHYHILLFMFGIALVGCSSGENGYELKNINVYREKNKVDKTIPIRFYKDNPNVPYVGIKEYFKEFYKTDLKVNKENNYNVFYFKSIADYYKK